MPLSKKIPAEIASATITLQKIDEFSLYSAELISTNGNIFHPYDMETSLVFRVFLNSKDITSEFKDITWSCISFDENDILNDEIWGIQYKGKSIITIDKTSFKEKCIIQADAYTVVDGKRTCVASARTTLLDVNELYSSETPPENPADGQLWVDTGGDIPIIYSWNDSLKKWVVAGKTTPTVRNLIMNSNFYTLNEDKFEVDNTKYLYSPTIKFIFEKNWLKLKTKAPTESALSTCGIAQTTSFPINKNSDYTFSLLSYCENDIEYKGTQLYIKIYSIDDSDEQTELVSQLTSLSNLEYNRFNYTFKTLNNTVSIRIIISVEPMVMSNFNIAELSLYNTDNAYPWEPAPEDLQDQINNKLDSDHNAVFNALTKNGTMEGFYIGLDENNEEHYYFNASHLKTGSIDGGLINGQGLNIKDEVSGQSIFHVYTDDSGTHIDMVAENLYIGSKIVTTETYVEEQVGITKTDTMNYIDQQLENSTKEIQDLMSGSISNSSKELTSYIDKQIEESLASSNSAMDSSISNVKNDITKAKQEAITEAVSQAKTYSNTLDTAIRKDLTSHMDTANEFMKTTNEKLSNLTGTTADPKKSFYGESFYSNKDVSFTTNKTETVTLDTLLNAIDISTKDLNISLDVSKIANTNYVSLSEDNSKAYLNLYEVIKFLLYKIKQLENKE